MDAATFAKALHITARVAHMLELFYRAGRHPTIEQIQDNVEKAISAEGDFWGGARAYIVYRTTQATQWQNRYEENGLGDYIAIAKYARYRADLGRRELFVEAAQRVRDMHRVFFRDRLSRPLAAPSGDSPVAREDRRWLTEWLSGWTLGDALDRAFEAVAAKRVLPSMRSLQFGGEAILRNHARLFNCSFSAVDRVDFFREYLFLLLAGTGCGFSVQRQHVERLPLLPVRGEEMDLRVCTMRWATRSKDGRTRSMRSLRVGQGGSCGRWSCTTCACLPPARCSVAASGVRRQSAFFSG